MRPQIQGYECSKPKVTVFKQINVSYFRHEFGEIEGCCDATHKDYASLSKASPSSSLHTYPLGHSTPNQRDKTVRKTPLQIHCSSFPSAHRGNIGAEMSSNNPRHIIGQGLYPYYWMWTTKIRAFHFLPLLESHFSRFRSISSMQCRMNHKYKVELAFCSG